MHLTPDSEVLWHWRFVHINATLIYTWLVMLLLTVASGLIMRRLDLQDGPRSRWQNALEAIVDLMRGQIREICPQGDRYLPFVGTLFLFIATSNLLDVVPGWRAPTVRFRPRPPWPSASASPFRFSECCVKAWADISGITCGLP